MKNVIHLLALTACLCVPALAQTVKIAGELRERSEFDTKSLTLGTPSDVYHFLRTRLKADAAINDQVTVVMEVQDARKFGMTGSTMNSGSANNPPEGSAFDLRQGFVHVKDIKQSGIGFKLGRQVLSYANQRLLGAIDWSNLGQSFDAFVVKGTMGDISVDLIGASVRRNLNMPSYNRDVFLAGAWLVWKPASVKSTAQGYFFYDNPKTISLEQRRRTAGVYGNGTYESFDFEVDGALQFGEYMHPTPVEDVKIDANMVGIRVGYTVRDAMNLRIGLGFDRLSGNDSSKTDTYGAFHTLYATNHKFYGFMDYFTNIPSSVSGTSGLGLMDIIVQCSFKPMDDVKVGADLHIFSTVITPKDAQGKELKKDLGMEVDLEAAWKIADVVSMTLGVSVFDWNRERAILTGRKTTNWAHLTTIVSF